MFVDDGMVLGWVFLMLLWNYMARSKSADDIGLRSSKKNGDSMLRKLSGTKVDKS